MQTQLLLTTSIKYTCWNLMVTNTSWYALLITICIARNNERWVLHRLVFFQNLSHEFKVFPLLAAYSVVPSIFKNVLVSETQKSRQTKSSYYLKMYNEDILVHALRANFCLSALLPQSPLLFICICFISFWWSNIH